MFASRPCNMRGPRLKTPLLLFLLLLTALTGTVLCQSEDETETGDLVTEAADQLLKAEEGTVTSAAPDTTDPGATTTTVLPATEGSDSGSGQGTETHSRDPNETAAEPGVTTPPPTSEDDGLSIIIILIPVVLVVIIIAMIVCGIFINRRWNNKARNQELRKEDPYLEGSSTEKVPMPMFEEDVPSVLELEMEELDQWMKKDGDTTEEPQQA